MYPNSIKNLVESFRLLPGIGEKTAERLAFFLLELDNEKVEFFSNSLKEIKNKIKKCPICNNYTENEICNICNDNTRNNKTLCVIEEQKSLYLFEKIGTYHGQYHILNGLISPLEGINPEDIGMEQLIKRIEQNEFAEIIIAVKPSVEGETTSLYIKKVLSNLNLKVTKIASGIPMGTDIEYIDALTLERALADRKELE